MKSMLVLLVLILGISSFAGVTDNQIEIKIEKEKISLNPKKGFHLNAEGPASAVLDDLEALNKPTVKTEKLFVFKKLNETKKAKLSFYVCDDKKTVCEKHEENLVFSSEEKIQKKDNKLKSNYNSIKEFNLKSENGKPTLLVFSAPWCPACIRMMTETYHKPEVEKQIAKLNFIKLNSDLPENNDLSEKFKIRAIPTLILIDKNGEEVFRWLDFQPAKGFAKALEVELQKVNLAELNLASAKMGDPSAASTLAYRAFAALDYPEAYKWFALTTAPVDQKFKLASEVNMAQEALDENETKTKEYLSTLQKAIVLTSSKLDQIRWTLDYFEKKAEIKELNSESQAKATSLVGDIEYLLKNKFVAQTSFKESTYGDYSGLEAEELLNMKARLAKIVENKKLEEEAKKESIARIATKKYSVDRPGEMLMLISYLKEAGDTKLVEELYQKLIKKYPSSYVYFEKYARFAQKNKQLDKALELTNAAVKYPEGNEPQLGLLKAQLLKELNKNEEAVLAIEETLKVTGIDHKRYAKTVKKLKDLKNEIKDGFDK